MRYLSLFSGIEAATVAWRPLGWECIGVAEIEKFPSEVLQHHYPQVPNFGDITKITEEDIKGLGDIDLIVGGFPCQDLSVAGKRKGLKNDDGTLTRSGLFFVAMRLVGWARKHCGCRYVLIENVPGLLSSHKGTDFAAVVAEMAGLRDVTTPKNGWGNEGAAVGCRGLLEWSILDAQWFGVAQRRRRVFALADFGDWTSRPPVLLEREGVRRDTPPSREKGERAAARITGGIDYEGNAHGPDDATGPLLKGSPSGGGHPLPAICMATGKASAEIGIGIGIGIGTTLNCNHEAPIVLMDQGGGVMNVMTDGAVGTLRRETHGHEPTIMQDMAVRRLTPIECERLQGFPDNYTLAPHRGKPAADGPRYKALGNSMAVPVMRWIGARIEAAKRGLLK